MTILFHPRSGLDRFVIELAERLLARRHAVALPHLFGAFEPTQGDDPDAAKRLLRDEDVLAVARRLTEQIRPRAPRGQIRALGCCMGGRLAFLCAAEGVVDRGCGIYGGEVTTGWHSTRAPVARVSSASSPVLLVTGTADSNATVSQQVEAGEAYARHGRYLEAVTFAGARHAFMDRASSERYHAAYAERAWALAMTFLEAGE